MATRTGRRLPLRRPRPAERTGVRERPERHAPRSICLVADEEIATIPRPPHKSRDAQAGYVSRSLDIVARSLHAVRALHWSPPLRRAFAIEAAGLALQRQQVPAIRRGDVMRERMLGDRAARVTHPADVVLTRAGLGACVGA
jgi:hypothetical protein